MIPCARPAAVAGTFYPRDPFDLRLDLERYFHAAPVYPLLPKAIIVPHAGYVFSGSVAASAYCSLRQFSTSIKRVVVLGPAHRVSVRGLVTVSHSCFKTPLGDILVDRSAVEELCRRFAVEVFDEAHEAEHCVEVQLPFLQQIVGNFELIPLIVGDVTPEIVADVIEFLGEDDGTLIVISTDLSHYHSYLTACEADWVTSKRIEALDSSRLTGMHACGCYALKGLLEYASRNGFCLRNVDYQNSGDTAGDKDHVVGYLASYCLTDEDRHQVIPRRGLSFLVQSAYETMAACLGMKSRQLGDEALVNELGASFVTLKKNGDLRGCVGSLNRCQSLVEDVCSNAQAAAFRDDRFSPLTAQEFCDVRVSVSVLTPEVKLDFSNEADLLSEIKPGLDGLVLRDGMYRGTFLPSVWEEIPDVENFWRHLKNKAGLPQHYWSETLEVSRYRACYLSEGRHFS